MLVDRWGKKFKQSDGEGRLTKNKLRRYLAQTPRNAGVSGVRWNGKGEDG